MQTKDLKTIIGEHPFMAGFPAAFLEGMAAHARLDICNADEYLFKSGKEADCCYLIREGLIAIELHHPAHGAMTVQTVDTGHVMGWSWLVEPYKWSFDARAVNLTRGICIDASWLRENCEKDHEFGYQIMNRFMPVLADRIEAARVQLLDLYGSE
jgi:CRP-like cAMP-binding protein